MLVVSVSDDGVGFEASIGGPAGSFGIKGMRERASLLGGRLELHSTSQSGPGASVRAVLPVPHDALTGTAQVV
jgi:signal transduction histidine kinase